MAFGLMWSGFLFSLLWFLYTVRFSVAGLILYSRLAADFTFLWTGNFFDRGLFYTIALIITALFTLEAASRSAKDISFRTSR